MRRRDAPSQAERLMLASYRKRAGRRLSVWMHDLEPQSKKMPASDQDKFQASVIEQVESLGRAPFAGPVALQIDLGTTSRTAPQAHTIAKNLLDLLGKRRATVSGKRNHLLYKDDAQIQALSVSCRHGEEQSSIHVTCRPLAALLNDLELAAEKIREDETESHDSWYRQEQEEGWIEDLRRLKRDEQDQRRRLGDAYYEAHLKLVRWSAQRALLSRSAIDIPVLGWMYGRPKGASSILPPHEWARLIGQSKLRLQLGDLPIKSGSSEAFKRRIDEEIALFKERWGWIIDPLVIAVALEVIVRPNPATPKAVLHDLDNIVRDYLLPKIVPSFGTVTDHRWTIDFDELRRTDPDLADRWGPNPTPPAGTKWGVTRYEAWRLPAAPGGDGFVSVALLADMDVRGDTMQRIDERARKWADDQTAGSSRSRWR